MDCQGIPSSKFHNLAKFKIKMIVRIFQKLLTLSDLETYRYLQSLTAVISNP